MRRVALFYIFVNFFNVCFNNKQLDSHLLYSISYDLFWLQYFNKIQFYTDICLEKSIFINFSDNLWIFFLGTALKLKKY